MDIGCITELEPNWADSLISSGTLEYKAIM